MEKMSNLTKVLSVLFLLAIVLSACAAPATEPAAPPPEEAPEEAAPAEEAPAEEEMMGPFRVAVVMPSAINDLAFSQSMYDALTAIQGEMGEDNFEFCVF